ncbi:GNAT family N-acetyltransferase [Streptomyces sp. NPDC006290]|uniref:GNAT family N-acetyltransferase n=1 Tax=Streptomyces sp. NPDC006290 TaxID=3156745 RepID=UPI0033A96203
MTARHPSIILPAIRNGARLSIRITALTEPQQTSTARRLAWLAAAPDGHPVGSAFLRLFTKDGQRHLAELDVQVDPAERRRGAGSVLLGAAVAAARQGGRRSVISQAEAGTPGADFLTADGFRAVPALTYARLPPADADLPALTAGAESPHAGHQSRRGRLRRVVPSVKQISSRRPWLACRICRFSSRGLSSLRCSGHL